MALLFMVISDVNRMKRIEYEGCHGRQLGALQEWYMHEIYLFYLHTFVCALMLFFAIVRPNDVVVSINNKIIGITDEAYEDFKFSEEALNKFKDAQT